MNSPLLILKTGSAFPALIQSPGDFDGWIKRGLDSARAARPQRVSQRVVVAAIIFALGALALVLIVQLDPSH